MTEPAIGAPGQLDVGYRRVLVPLGSARVPLRMRSIVVGVTILVAIVALAIWSLGLGDYALSPHEVLIALGGGGEGLDNTVVVRWRLPRVLAAVVLGGVLAIAGALFQTVTQNPLASPDVLGLSNGAFTGMLLTTVFVSTSWPMVTTGAVLGGVVTAALIWTLANKGGVQGFRLIVVGIGIAAMLASANTWMLLKIELETAMFASAWGAGSLNGATGDAVFGAIVCAIPLLLATMLLTPRLRQLDLGEDVANATGARPNMVRAAALIIAVGFVSIATAVVGPVAFIALAAPQVARRLAGTPYLPMVVSALTGGLLLLGSDMIAQHLLPLSLPAGVVTVSVGGLYLVITIVLEIRRRA